MERPNPRQFQGVEVNSYIRTDINEQLNNYDEDSREMLARLGAPILAQLDQYLERQGWSLATLSSVIQTKPEAFGILNELVSANENQDRMTALDRLMELGDA